MPYQDHFALADDYITHSDQFVGGIADPFILSRYAGFLSVCAVTVYELAIKTVFIEFAEKKHKVLGHFTEKHFSRINGRIKTQVIKDDYVARFGDKYVNRFEIKLAEKERLILRTQGVSVRSSYANIITWRNGFAHEGIVPANATYSEVKRSYEAGKAVIETLAETMVR